MDTWYYLCFLLDFPDLTVVHSRVLPMPYISIEFEYCSSFLSEKLFLLLIIDGEDIIQNIQKLPPDVWSSLSNLQKGQFQGENLI